MLHLASKGVLAPCDPESTLSSRLLSTFLTEYYIWSKISFPTILLARFALVHRERVQRVRTSQGSRHLVADWAYSPPLAQNHPPTIQPQALGFRLPEPLSHVTNTSTLPTGTIATAGRSFRPLDPRHPCKNPICAIFASCPTLTFHATRSRYFMYFLPRVIRPNLPIRFCPPVPCI